MRVKQQTSRIVAGALALVFVGQAALANWGYTPGKGMRWEYAEGKAFTAGMDMRLRLTHWDRSVLWPEGDGPDGPAFEYLRFRTRLMLGLDLWDGAKLNARFVNRMHNVSSSPSNPNDNGAATWQYPDEVILDQLALTLTDLGVEGLSVVLGRQDFLLGNGMVMLEGTPYDQGRTIYFDGISALYKTQCDAIKVFAFYNEDEDEFVVMGDEDRLLRRGNIFTTGIDWTHTFNETVATEVYYIFANIEDDFADLQRIEREYDANSNGELHTVGARVFGKLNERTGYSVEVAHQFGEYDENPSPGEDPQGSADMEGWMVDARLTVSIPELPTKPDFMLEYTYFSGDDSETDGDYEGWDGIFAEYPIYREELLPILNNGNWTNLHQFRLQGKCTLFSNPECGLVKNVTLTGSYAHLRADEADTGYTSGGGTGDSHFGDLFTAFLDVKLNEYVTVSLEAAAFESGAYWSTDENSKWLRFQTVISF